MATSLGESLRRRMQQASSSSSSSSIGRRRQRDALRSLQQFGTIHQESAIMMKVDGSIEVTRVSRVDMSEWLDKDLGTTSAPSPSSSSANEQSPYFNLRPRKRMLPCEPLITPTDASSSHPTSSRSSMLKLITIFQSFSFHASLCLKLFVRLTLILLKGTRTWLFVLSRLILFTTIMLPGFIPMLRYYFLSKNIHKNIPYGQGARFRNLLDVYVPTPHSSSQTSSKVIIFVSGGAWTIGYKLWSCLAARGLCMLGYLVVVPDYRNFPQGRISDMKDDVRAAVLWTHAHASAYGGDCNCIVLAGQSAGAHITLAAIIDDCNNHPSSSSSNPRLTDVVRLYVGVSGPYHLAAMQSHLHTRGLDSSLLAWVCDNNIVLHSPYIAIQNMSEAALSRLPPIALIHGSRDVTIPCSETINLLTLLEARGRTVFGRIYSGWTHTDAILEAPMTGDFRALRDVAHIADVALRGDAEEWTRMGAERDDPLVRSRFFIDAKADADRKHAFAPQWLGWLARKANPF